jgi:short-subunit dehydrogenase
MRKTALITGASSGIGAAFARKLAAQQYDLVLIARRKERLTSLATELHQQFHVDIEVLVADLSCPADIEHIEQRIGALGALDMLVNDAGFGTPGTFVENPVERYLEMIAVHVLASVRLCHAALPGMIARGQGAIINVSSLGAFLTAPSDETYCATKAYLNVFSEALQAELVGTGVRVQALCPGFTDTEFHDQSVYEQYHVKANIPKALWMSADEVVEQSLKALKRGHVICIPGFKNYMLVALARSPLKSLLLQVWENSLRVSLPDAERP